MALNLGRLRTDNTGSLNTILNSIKPGKVAFPKFTGKNANELNALALFIEDKFNSGHDFNRDLTSSNVDTTLERLHTTFIKLKEASDSDNLASYELLKSDIIDQVRGLTADTGKEKPKETLWSDEDKEFLKDLIAASTLTEATEKTSDLTGENGLTKDDIDHALDVTIKNQLTLNNDVVAAAQEANQIEADASTAANVKDELQQMFKDNSSDDSTIDELSDKNTTQFLKLLDMVSSQVGHLNAHINIVGDNFKNSPIFNYKNPFTGAVGKIPSVVETLSGTFEKLNDKIQLGITNAKVPFEKITDAIGSVKDSISGKISSISDDIITSSKDMLGSLNDKVQAGIAKAKVPFDSISKMMSNIKDGIIDKVAKIKTPFQKVADGTKKIGKGIANIKNGIANKAKATKDFVVNLPKIIIGKIKDIMIGLLKKALNLLKKPFEMIKKFFIMIGLKLLGILAKLGKAILGGLKTVMFFIFKAIFSIIKAIAGKFKKNKKDSTEKKEKKPSKLSGLFGVFKKPMALSEKIIKRIALTTVGMLKRKKKKSKKPGLLNKVTAVLPPLTSKEKKDKKKTSGLFKKLGDFMKHIGDIIKNIVKHICDIIGQIIIALCTAIAKGIGIILRAIFLTPWGLIILASILLISIGILLISLAVKKLVDYIVDDLGPIIKEKLKQINPETLNRFIDKVSKFIDVFTSILAGAFAPIIAIGTIIKNIIEPAGKLIKIVANVVVKILKPLLEGLADVIVILLKPIMILLKFLAKVIATIWSVMEPVLNTVLNVIRGIFSILVPIYQIVFGIIGKALIAIGKILKTLWDALEPLIDIIFNNIVVLIKMIATIIKFIIKTFIQPIWNIVKGVILGILDIINEVMQEIEPIITVVVNVLIKGILMFIKSLLIPMRVTIWLIKKIINGLVAAYEYAKEKVIKAYQAIKEFFINIFNWVKEKVLAIFDVVSKIVSAVIDGIKFVIKLILFPILLPIKIGIAVIKGIVSFIGKIINKIREFWNWLKDKLASIEIPLPWPLDNIHPFGWLKGAGDSKQEAPAPETNEESQKIIDDLNSQLAEIQEKFNESQNTIKTLQEKLKEASATTISKFAILKLIVNSDKTVKILSSVEENLPNTGSKPKLSFTQESVKTQFSSIDNINNKNKENMNNISEDLEDMNEENESSESDDITNTDLRVFLLKMFENVDISFAKINKKLDNPLVLPMPTPMNITNLALIGTN